MIKIPLKLVDLPNERLRKIRSINPQHISLATSGAMATLVDLRNKDNFKDLKRRPRIVDREFHQSHFCSGSLQSTRAGFFGLIDRGRQHFLGALGGQVFAILGIHCAVVPQIAPAE